MYLFTPLRNGGQPRPPSDILFTKYLFDILLEWFQSQVKVNSYGYLQYKQVFKIV